MRDLLGVLELDPSEARTTEDIFTGPSERTPHHRVFGGQVLAQSVIAATRTVEPDRRPHSMHGYFLRPGNDEAAITFAVDRIHDGRSFSTRRVQAYQAGVPIFSMIASFQREQPGVEHQAAMPEGLPEPESLPSLAEYFSSAPELGRMFWGAQSAFDLRHVDGAVYLSVEGHRVPHQAVWMRATQPLPDDPAVHRAALAYASDYTILESVLRAHGLAWATPGLSSASLDHAMWWHRDGRADEWMLYAQESPNAIGGRGLALGRIYSRGGALLASVAQEGMVKVPSL